MVMTDGGFFTALLEVDQYEKRIYSDGDSYADLFGSDLGRRGGVC